MCQKPGKTLIPIDKPQVYFVDVVKCVNEVCLQTHLALPTAWNARPPSEWICAPIVWEIWYRWLTNGPTAHVPWADHRGRPGVQVGWVIQPTRTHGRPRWSAQGTRVLDREADWSTAPVIGNFNEFHNQLLTHWHSYQIADLFNRRNITGLNH